MGKDEFTDHEWHMYLTLVLRWVSYSMAAPTIVSLTFHGYVERVLEDVEKVRKVRVIMRGYGAYETGPTILYVPGRSNVLSFGFREQQQLDAARRDLDLPEELQSGQPIYI